MQFKTDEQLRKYLTKKVEHDISCKSWKFNGIKFISWSGYLSDDYYSTVEYTCDLRQLTARLTRGYEFNGTYQVIAEKNFNSNNAISECITWVVETLMEIYKQLSERIAPYINNKVMYDMLVKRPIVLRGD